MATALETTPSDLSERTTPSLGSDDTDADVKRAPQTLYLKKHRVPALPTLQNPATVSDEQEQELATQTSVFDRFSATDIQALLGEFVQTKLESYGPKFAFKATKGPYAKAVAKRRALDDSQVTYESVSVLPKPTPLATTSSSTEKRRQTCEEGEPPLKVACLPGIQDHEAGEPIPPPPGLPSSHSSDPFQWLTLHELPSKCILFFKKKTKPFRIAM